MTNCGRVCGPGRRIGGRSGNRRCDRHRPGSRVGGLVGSSSEPPGSSASPEHSPSSSDAPPRVPRPRHRRALPSNASVFGPVSPAMGRGPRAAARPWSAGSSSRLTRKLSTDDDTTPEERPASAPERTGNRSTPQQPRPAQKLLHQRGESDGFASGGRRPRGEAAVRGLRKRATELPISPTQPSFARRCLRDTSTANILERRRSRHELASVTRTGGQAVDIGTAADAPIDAVASAAAQIPAACDAIRGIALDHGGRPSTGDLLGPRRLLRKSPASSLVCWPR